MDRLEDRTNGVNLVGIGTDLVRKGYNWGKNHFNYKIGLYSAMGSAISVAPMAFAANYKHGLNHALWAYGKQVLFNGLMGSFNTRLCQKLSVRYPSKAASLAVSSVVPALESGILLYFYHKSLGTKEAGLTASILTGVNLFVFLGEGWYFRRKHERGEKKGLLIDF